VRSRQAAEKARERRPKEKRTEKRERSRECSIAEVQQAGGGEQAESSDPALIKEKNPVQDREIQEKEKSAVQNSSSGRIYMQEL